MNAAQALDHARAIHRSVAQQSMVLPVSPRFADEVMDLYLEALSAYLVDHAAVVADFDDLEDWTAERRAAGIAWWNANTTPPVVGKGFFVVGASVDGSVFSARDVGPLYNADDDCDHDVQPAPGGGVKCTRCPGWFCF